MLDAYGEGLQKHGCNITRRACLEIDQQNRNADGDCKQLSRGASFGGVQECVHGNFQATQHSTSCLKAFKRFSKPSLLAAKDYFYIVEQGETQQP